jgi:hypothetical protein
MHAAFMFALRAQRMGHPRSQGDIRGVDF